MIFYRVDWSISHVLRHTVLFLCLIGVAFSVSQNQIAFASDPEPGSGLVTFIVEVVNDDGGTITTAQNVATIYLDVGAAPIEAESGTAYSFPAGSEVRFSVELPFAYSVASVTGEGCPDRRAGTIVVNDGDNIVCTMVVDDIPATLLVDITVVNDDGGTAVSSDFTVDIDATDVVYLPPNGRNDIAAEFDAGAFNVTIPNPGNYTVSYRDCSGIAANNELYFCRITLDDVPTTAGVVYVSYTGRGRIDNVRYEDEDILAYDPSTGSWSLYFDGSDVGFGATSQHDVNAFHIRDDGSILMSIRATATIPDVGQINNTDIVLFTPTSVGKNTAGTFSLYLDGSDVGLTTGGEDITAVYEAANGDLIISTVGNNKVGSLGLSGDEDLLRFSGSYGPNSTGSWSLYFDGSDVDMQSSTEEIQAVFIDEASNSIFLSMRGNYQLGGISGDQNDIVVCANAITGPATSCNYAPFSESTELDRINRDLDGFSIKN